MRNKAGVIRQISTKFREWRLNAKKLRESGDLARDSGKWVVASKFYRQYLNLVSDDVAIWIQYGHALKESNFLLEAENAYRQASLIAPNDVDARIHLGHLLKRTNQPQDAKNIFSEILEIQPTNEIHQELKRLIDNSTTQSIFYNRPSHAVQGGIYFELKDLFSYLSQHTTVTGITRVTLGITNYVLENMDDKKGSQYFFVHQFRDAEGVMLISHNNMRRVVKAALSGEANLLKMQNLLELIKDTSPIFRLEEGDSYVILGAFWEFVANPSWIGGMRSRGVNIGAYIYDLIPITHHQYCMKPLTDAFTVAFAETARLLDFSLTISSFVAEQVTDFLNIHNIAPMPILAVPLAHELRFKVESTSRFADIKEIDQVGSLEIKKKEYFTDVPFVLCVCTIEARKNHAYLFTIWQRMIEARIDVPDLVFVGRPGWRVSDLLDQIEVSNFLEGRLHILNGLTDDELSGLYERCLFTAFPSFVEGWGLPVGESLSHGKVCVASSASSIPEVGGDYAIYVDPFDINSGYAVISRLICDPSELARMQDKIQTSFIPRTWQDVGFDFFKKLDNLISTSKQNQIRRPFFAPNLDAGETLSVTKLSRIEKHSTGYVQNPTRLAFLDGWRGVESSGTWMLDHTARVRVETNCIPGQQVMILLQVGTSPWVGPQNTLQIEAVPAALNSIEMSGTPGYRRPMRRDENLWLTLPGLVDDIGCLTIRFQVNGRIQMDKSDALPVSLRFMRFSYVPASDVLARLGLLERAFLSPGSSLVHPEHLRLC